MFSETNAGVSVTKIRLKSSHVLNFARSSTKYTVSLCHVEHVHE